VVPLLKEVRDNIAVALDPAAEAILEDHGYSLCVHWHMVPPGKLDGVHQAVSAATQNFADIEVRTLPTSYEILPLMVWDKASALTQIDCT